PRRERRRQRSKRPHSDFARTRRRVLHYARPDRKTRGARFVQSKGGGLPHREDELPKLSGRGARGCHSTETAGGLSIVEVGHDTSGREPVSIRIAPSILSANFANLGEDIR